MWCCYRRSLDLFPDVNVDNNPKSQVMNQKMVPCSTSWWWAFTSHSWSEHLMPLTCPWKTSSCCVRTNKTHWSRIHPCQSRTWNRNVPRTPRTGGKRWMKVCNFLIKAKLCYTPDMVTSSLLIVLETEPPALRAARERRLEAFWLGLESVLESGSPESRLNDVVQLSYTVPNLRSSTEISDSEVSSNVTYFVCLFFFISNSSLVQLFW